MKKHIYFILVLLIALSLAGCTSPTKTLTISAASSLKNSLESIKVLYKQAKPNVEVTFNFGSSGDLQQQIENGAPVDVFVSAAKKQMNALEEKGLLLNGTKKNLLENKLVLITPKDKKIIKGFEDLATDTVKQIAIGEPASVPAGQYAQEVFTKFGFLDKIKPKTIYGKDVKQVLTYVEQGEVDAGVVYATDAKASSKVNIVSTAPKDSHTPVIYPVAVIKASKNEATSKEFIEFLFSDTAKAVFKADGFENL